jgi:dihydrodipicolinate reductase
VRLDVNFTQAETALTIDEVRVGDTVAAHDLIFHGVDGGETIAYDFEYKKECFLPGTVKNFYSIFHHLTKLVIRELALSVAE